CVLSLSKDEGRKHTPRLAAGRQAPSPRPSFETRPVTVMAPISAGAGALLRMRAEIVADAHRGVHPRWRRRWPIQKIILRHHRRSEFLPSLACETRSAPAAHRPSPTFRPAAPV